MESENMLVCPKCGKTFKRVWTWKKHIKYCVPRLTPKELSDLYRDLGLKKITDFYEEWERPICPQRGMR